MMFWVTDNFLMFKKPRQAETSLLDRVKIRYRLLRKHGRRKSYEADFFVSDDDELLDCEHLFLGVSGKPKPDYVI